MEYWIFFDLASGEELWRGSGTIGTAKMQPVPDGAGLIIVPQAVIAEPKANMPLLRRAICEAIDAAAELIRARYLTPGSGQAMVYARKEAEARSWLAGAASNTPFLFAEAQARGIAIADLAAEVVEKADFWVEVGSAIESRRMAAKCAVMESKTIGDVVRAAAIDWNIGLSEKV